jgi:hypothetical protein
MNDRLNGMRVFAQVVEAKSFSAAAERLGMSRRALLRALRQDRAENGTGRAAPDPGPGRAGHNPMIVDLGAWINRTLLRLTAVCLQCESAPRRCTRSRE